MSSVVISTIIGVASFILTIFSAIYLNQRHVDKLIEQMNKRFEARINESAAGLGAKIEVLRAELQGFRMEANARFDALQKEVVALQGRVERIEQALFRPVLPPRV